MKMLTKLNEWIELIKSIVNSESKNRVYSIFVFGFAACIIGVIALLSNIALGDKEQVFSQISTAGTTFRDCVECPEMVVIPAGSFEMGTNNGEDIRKPIDVDDSESIRLVLTPSEFNEYQSLSGTRLKEFWRDQERLAHHVNQYPIHHVTLANSFALGKTEVTQAQWRSVMGTDMVGYQEKCDTCPVMGTKWDDAQEFIQKLSDKTGKKYRLPSEAEWEYACHAGKYQKYCGSDNADEVAWFESNSDLLPHPVAGKQPNAWGLYDMSGNVWEWVEDRWNKNYEGAPTDGSAWDAGDESSLRRGSLRYTWRAYGREIEQRVLRGGSFKEFEGYRNKGIFYSKFDTAGFRVVRMLP
jgi:formylglycine-generating enzyme required for sulfatase activity